jgi:spoIIIJ-associated protein
MQEERAVHYLFKQQYQSNKIICPVVNSGDVKRIKNKLKLIKSKGLKELKFTTEMDQIKIKSLIEEFIKSLGVRFGSVEIKEDEITKKPVFIIKSEDSGLLIGEGGETFYAISHLIRRIANKGKEIHHTDLVGQVEERNDFALDINDYRASMVERLKIKAGILANRARDMKSNIEMDPMSSYERLIIHGALTDQPNIKTESVGEGKNRRIIIKYIG